MVYNNRSKRSKTLNYTEVRQDKNSEHINTVPPAIASLGDLRQTSCSATTFEQTSVQPNRNHADNSTVSDEAKRFAQTRYPFAPFLFRLAACATNIQEQKVVDDLYQHMKDEHQLVLELIGFRKSASKCSIPTECDILLFVKSSLSFSILYDEKNWPSKICGLSFIRHPPPSLPPQLSVLIKNVCLTTDFAQFAEELKSMYPNLLNVIRMKNKEQLNIKLVKLESNKPEQRNKLLAGGRVFVHSLSYDVIEYLAPAQVLICSKCMEIGHFRK